MSTSVIPQGRWQKCLLGNGEAAGAVEPGLWFDSDADVGADAAAAAADAIACAAATWADQSQPGACTDAVCIHDARAIVIAAGACLAVASRNGPALAALIAASGPARHATTACAVYKTADIGGASREAKALLKCVAPTTRTPGVRYHARDAANGASMGHPSRFECTVVDPDLPGPTRTEHALRWWAGTRLDPLALALADALCERRIAHAGRPDLVDFERALTGWAVLYEMGDNAESVAWFASGEPAHRASAIIQRFVAWCRVSDVRLGVFFNHMTCLASLGPGGTVAMACRIAAPMGTSRKRRKGASRTRGGPSRAEALHLTQHTVSAQWHLAQQVSPYDEAMLRAATARPEPLLPPGVAREGWAAMAQALTSDSGPIGVEAACAALARVSTWIASLVLDALATPALWDDPVPWAGGGEWYDLADNIREREMPPWFSLLRIGVCYPDALLNPARKATTARITASLRARHHARLPRRPYAPDDPHSPRFDASAWLAASAHMTPEPTADPKETPWVRTTVRLCWAQKMQHFAAAVLASEQRGHITVWPDRARQHLQRMAAA